MSTVEERAWLVVEGGCRRWSGLVVGRVGLREEGSGVG